MGIEVACGDNVADRIRLADPVRGGLSGVHARGRGGATHQDFWESGMTTRTSHPRRACSVLAKEKMLGEESHGGPSSFCGMSAGGGTHGQEDGGGGGGRTVKRTTGRSLYVCRGGMAGGAKRRFEMRTDRKPLGKSGVGPFPDHDVARK